MEFPHIKLENSKRKSISIPANSLPIKKRYQLLEKREEDLTHPNCVQIKIEKSEDHVDIKPIKEETFEDCVDIKHNIKCEKKLLIKVENPVDFKRHSQSVLEQIHHLLDRSERLSKDYCVGLNIVSQLIVEQKVAGEKFGKFYKIFSDNPSVVVMDPLTTEAIDAAHHEVLDLNWKLHNIEEDALAASLILTDLYTSLRRKIDHRLNILARCTRATTVEELDCFNPSDFVDPPIEYPQIPPMYEKWKELIQSPQLVYCFQFVTD